MKCDIYIKRATKYMQQRNFIISYNRVISPRASVLLDRVTHRKLKCKSSRVLYDFFFILSLWINVITLIFALYREVTCARLRCHKLKVNLPIARQQNQRLARKFVWNGRAARRQRSIRGKRSSLKEHFAARHRSEPERAKKKCSYFIALIHPEIYIFSRLHIALLCRSLDC